MKKILTIALVALLAAGTVFAASISGSASVSLGYDTTSKVYGFSNDSGVKASIELAAETVENKEEADVYAGIKATMKLAVAPRKASGAYDIWTNGGDHGLGLWLSVDEAYVAGKDWKLDITGTKGSPDYAKSAIDTVKTDKTLDEFGNKKKDGTTKADSYSLSVWKGAGIALTYKGYTVAGGFSGDADGYTPATGDTVNKYFNFNLFAETKAFEFEGGSAQAAVIVASNDKEDKGNDVNLGFSVKGNYAKEAFSASLAGDFGFEGLRKKYADKVGVNFDVAAKVAYSPVTLDVYYQHGKKLLSAKVSGSYNDVVSGSVAFKNILVEESRNLAVSAEGTVDKLSLNGSVGLTFATKAFTAGVGAKYKADKYTVGGDVNFGIAFGTDNTTVFYVTASASTEALIPGATLSLTYGADSKSNDMNFLKDQKTAQNFGAVTATCEISF